MYAIRSYYGKTYFTDDKQLEAVYNPIKQYHQNKLFNNKNVVIIILESFSKEYVGALNSHLDGGHYNGYTPFLDSLIHNGLVYTNATLVRHTGLLSKNTNY